MNITRRKATGSLIASGATLAANPALAQQAEERTVIQRLHWAGVKIERGGVALYIDAIAPPDPVAYDASSERRTKYALISHGHGDHFDIEYLRDVLGDRGVIFCHEDALGDLDMRTLRVQAVDHWEPVFLPRSGADIVAFAVPASDGFGISQTSWALRCGDTKIIHCGDTLWHGEFWDVGRALGPFELAFLPINGARQTVGRFADLGVPGVLTPDQAVAAAIALRARVVVPIHYGSPDPPHYVETERNLDRFRSEARRRAIDVRVLDPGESITL